MTAGPREAGRSTGAPSSAGARAPFHCGVDVGAAATKLVLLDAAGEVAARSVRPSGVDYAAAAWDCLAEALLTAGAGAGMRVPLHTVATGYGRANVPFADGTLTEIHCHAAGAFHHCRRAVTVIDIGGQDSKVILLGADGQRLGFRMNRKCAAGTGAFLEEIAVRLGLPLGELDALAAAADRAVGLSSFCTVFAKTEILAHLRAGEPVQRIVRGAFEAVVTRILEMAALEGDVVLTGGVVQHNPTVACLLAERLGREVEVPPHPQTAGALGAALAARKRASAPA